MPHDYEPNGADDRAAVNAGWGETYRALASAIEEADAAYADMLSADNPPPQTMSATRRGARALRQAAFVLAIHARR
jgi:hypothetical protein